MISLDVDWKGLLLPFAYVLVLGGALMTFSTIYRKRKASQSANLAPWFGPHLSRNIYHSLLEMNAAAEESEKAPKVPDTVLRAALMRRAVEDIQRLNQIKNAKQSITSLLQRGSVGDDLMQSFTRAETELTEELRDVVTEANAYASNWGQAIFAAAHNMVANAKLRESLDEITSQTDAERAWWAQRKTQIKTEFLKELDEDEKSSKTFSGDEEQAVIVDTPSKKKKGKK